MVQIKILFTSSTSPFSFEKIGEDRQERAYRHGQNNKTCIYLYTARSLLQQQLEPKRSRFRPRATSLRRVVPHHYYIPTKFNDRGAPPRAEREHREQGSTTIGAQKMEIRPKTPLEKKNSQEASGSHKRKNCFLQAKLSSLRRRRRSNDAIFQIKVLAIYWWRLQARKNLGREVNVRELARASDRSGLTSSSSSSRVRKIDAISFRIFLHQKNRDLKLKVYSPSSGRRVKVVLLHLERSKNITCGAMYTTDDTTMMTMMTITTIAMIASLRPREKTMIIAACIIIIIPRIMVDSDYGASAYDRSARGSIGGSIYARARRLYRRFHFLCDSRARIICTTRSREGQRHLGSSSYITSRLCDTPIEILQSPDPGSDRNLLHHSRSHGPAGSHQRLLRSSCRRIAGVRGLAIIGKAPATATSDKHCKKSKNDVSKSTKQNNDCDHPGEGTRGDVLHESATVTGMEHKHKEGPTSSSSSRSLVYRQQPSSIGIGIIDTVSGKKQREDPKRLAHTPVPTPQPSRRLVHTKRDKARPCDGQKYY
ncbi:unnamed protein product [Trichogramma brassicae]|uniref:Uncharacterized protein n=1 Tax=Trichogramma brassicae TaxID=86971 RepID=A0A6H5J6K3_9HYME|nr:unnamed protein product [Trichogramma brassicae]